MCKLFPDHLFLENLITSPRRQWVKKDSFDVPGKNIMLLEVCENISKRKRKKTSKNLKTLVEMMAIYQKKT